MAIDLTHNAPQVIEQLQRLLEHTQDLSEPMADMAGILEGATERAFADQADVETGEPWPALSATTLALRPQRQNGMILQATGQLAASIHSDSGRDFAQIGTNKIYAAPHQFGVSKGQYGHDQRGRPLPWGDIPQRRYLGVSEEDQGDMLELISVRFSDI